MPWLKSSAEYTTALSQREIEAVIAQKLSAKKFSFGMPNYLGSLKGQMLDIRNAYEFSAGRGIQMKGAFTFSENESSLSVTVKPWINPFLYIIPFLALCLYPVFRTDASHLPIGTITRTELVVSIVSCFALISWLLMAITKRGIAIEKRKLEQELALQPRRL